MIDELKLYVGILIAALIALVGLMWAVDKQQEKAWLEFREACIEDRKEYECVAMWREGDKLFTPIPVFIPFR